MACRAGSRRSCRASSSSRSSGRGISLGGEYYSDMGKIGHVLPWNQQDNRIYGVIDFDMAPVVFNFGVGRGITDAADKWTAKAIIEVPLQAKPK